MRPIERADDPDRGQQLHIRRAIRECRQAHAEGRDVDPLDREIRRQRRVFARKRQRARR